MKKMLYMMGIEWNWIFQRPQILANFLEEDYILTVVCPKQMIGGKRQNNDKPERLIELLQIPFQEKVSWIGRAANYFHRKKLGDLNDYDAIWVGYPLFGRYIPKDYQGIVIYDCMDNHEALFPDQRPVALQKVIQEEKKLIKRADLVFVSSLKLKEKIKILCPEKKAVLVRNGYGNLEICAPSPTAPKDAYYLGYIGTISKWLDHKVLIQSRRRISSVYYCLIGPVDAQHSEIEEEGIAYCGVVEHAKLGERVRELDGLLMPFMINDIILYVDPVKLYEYIAWGKCIISSWYPEIERFQEFVYFYHDETEYLTLIEELAEKGFPAKYGVEQQKTFLAENTWEARATLIKGELAKSFGI